MQEYISKAQELVLDSASDGVAVALLNFKEHKFECFEILACDVNRETPQIYFDLASLTKPLTNSFIKIAEKIKGEEFDLLLNHRAGLPAWGLLSTSDWKEQILSYPVKASETLYSDFSALRFMLEVEKLKGKDYKELAFKNLNEEIKFWMDLDGNEICLQNGYYHGRQNVGIVHDPNAFNLKTFMSHAGLFGTISGVAEALISFDKEFSMLKHMYKLLNSREYRFVEGFDTVENPENTLAGKGCSKNTFGHLGFTGTSFWIDTEKEIGHIILSNATKHHWYDKKELNAFRRMIGEMAWRQA